MTLNHSECLLRDLILGCWRSNHEEVVDKASTLAGAVASGEPLPRVGDTLMEVAQVMTGALGEPPFGEEESGDVGVAGPLGRA